MIPASYLFKDMYHDHWGDPASPHAVTETRLDDGHRIGLIARIHTLVRRLPRLTPHPRPVDSAAM